MTPQLIMRIGGALYLKSKLNDAGQYVPQHPDAKWDTLEHQQSSIETEIECLRWAPAYAEPGYTDSKKGVLFANWNYFDNRTCDLLEKYGYETEWSDEWDQCENCQKAVRKSPDSYSWRPAYALVDDCTILCTKCFLEDEDSVKEFLKTKENRLVAIGIVGLDPAKYGYRLLEAGFENGWHPGQNDDPKKITADLRTAGVKTPLLFKVDETRQFDTEFSVWTRDEETEKEDQTNEDQTQ